MPDKILRVIYDLETTGFCPLPLVSKFNKIVQLAALNLETDETFASFVFPHESLVDIPKQSTMIHSIRRDDVCNADTIVNVMIKLSKEFNFEKYDKVELIAHNNYFFDKIMLLKEIDNALDMSNILFWDTLPFLRKKYSGLKSYNLGKLFKTFFGCELENAHRADADVYALAKIYREKVEPYRKDDETPNFTSQCIVDIKFLGQYRANLFYKEFGISTVDELREFALGFLIRNDDTGFDNALRLQIGMKSLSQRISVVGFVYNIPLWNVQKLRQFMNIPYDDDVLDPCDYYVKYRWYSYDRAPNRHLYYKGMECVRFKIN